MGIRVGTGFFGKVDVHGEESVQTKFFILAGPLIPLQSWYVLRERADGLEGFEVPLSASSVLAGYGRTWFFVLGVLASVFSFAFSELEWLRLPAVALAVIWAFMFFAFGRLDGTERKKRRLLGALLGISAPPALVPPETAARARATLETSLASEGIALDAGALSVVSGGRALPIAWAYAGYANMPEVAESLWKSIEAGSTESPELAPVVTTCADCGRVWRSGDTFCGACGFRRAA